MSDEPVWDETIARVYHLDDAPVRTSRVQSEATTWRCKTCKRPSFLMFDPHPREDGLCRRCRELRRLGI